MLPIGHPQIEKKDRILKIYTRKTETKHNKITTHRSRTNCTAHYLHRTA